MPSPTPSARNSHSTMPFHRRRASDRSTPATSSTPQVPAFPPPPVPSNMRGMRRLEMRRGMEETHYLAQQRSQRTTLNPAPDMRLLDYVTEYDGNLMCPICRCPFVDPVILSDCDHCFCRECLSQVWTEYHPGGPRGNCPTCRAQSRLAAKGAVSKILVNLLDELLVRCPRHDEGCPREIKRGEVKDHVEKYCDWAFVQCPRRECEQLVRRKDASQCLHWGVACIDCKEHMFVSHLEIHWQTACPDRKVPCHLCNSQIDYRTLNSHTTESCPALLLSCPGSSCGCSFRSTRAEVTHHTQSCVFASLAPIFLAQQKRIDQVEEEKSVQARELQALRKDMQTLKTSIDETRMPELDEPNNPAQPEQIPFTLEARVDRRRERDELGEQDTTDVTLDHDGRITFPLHDDIVFPAPPSASRLRSGASLHDTDTSQPSAPFFDNIAYDANFDAASFYSLEHDRSRSHNHSHLSGHLSNNDGHGSYASPVQHLLSLHESLRDEVTRLASALHDLDGRHSMLILNENLRLKEDMAFLNAQFSGLGRQVSWLTSARLQSHNQQNSQPSGRDQADAESDNDRSQSGSSQRQAASGSMRDAATALRGAARMVNLGTGRDTLGFGRRAGSDEGRTKL